jgi:glycine C-acetyltransferase
MFGSMKQHVARQLDEIRAAGTYKQERVITSPQNARIRVGDGQPVQ